MTRTILYLWNRGKFTEDSTQPLIDLIVDEDETMRIKTGRQKDHEADVQVGFEQGIERGIEQGVDIGLQRGLDLEKIEVIQKMLAKNYDWISIQEITQVDQTGFDALLAKDCK